VFGRFGVFVVFVVFVACVVFVAFVVLGRGGGMLVRGRREGEGGARSPSAAARA